MSESDLPTATEIKQFFQFHEDRRLRGVQYGEHFIEAHYQARLKAYRALVLLARSHCIAAGCVHPETGKRIMLVELSDEDYCEREPGPELCPEAREWASVKLPGGDDGSD
jgi:hypothetical protein